MLQGISFFIGMAFVIFIFGMGLFFSLGTLLGAFVSWLS